MNFKTIESLESITYSFNPENLLGNLVYNNWRIWEALKIPTHDSKTGDDFWLYRVHFINILNYSDLIVSCYPGLVTRYSKGGSFNINLQLGQKYILIGMDSPTLDITIFTRLILDAIRTINTICLMEAKIII